MKIVKLVSHLFIFHIHLNKVKILKLVWHSFIFYIHLYIHHTYIQSVCSLKYQYLYLHSECKPLPVKKIYIYLRIPPTYIHAHIPYRCASSQQMKEPRSGLAHSYKRYVSKQVERKTPYNYFRILFTTATDRQRIVVAQGMLSSHTSYPFIEYHNSKVLNRWKKALNSSHIFLFTTGSTGSHQVLSDKRHLKQQSLP